jgi:hypothetical protein
MLKILNIDLYIKEYNFDEFIVITNKDILVKKIIEIIKKSII